MLRYCVVVTLIYITSQEALKILNFLLGRQCVCINLSLCLWFINCHFCLLQKYSINEFWFSNLCPIIENITYRILYLVTLLREHAVVLLLLDAINFHTALWKLINILVLMIANYFTHACSQCKWNRSTIWTLQKDQQCCNWWWADKQGLSFLLLNNLCLRHIV